MIYWHQCIYHSKAVWHWPIGLRHHYLEELYLGHGSGLNHYYPHNFKMWHTNKNYQMARARLHNPAVKGGSD